ncbi:hypothetical protein EVAR_89666_1 [Eumeta japonica]|uniref:Ras association domain-containing protein n=1 Tax=Eumeta variegata TaxID=151549 RepID=A0A4C1YBZ5_EUMVA|nr:hypothetical protein EVAR_89666_1 [Eumeta japonica]
MIVRVWCESGAGWAPALVPVTPHSSCRDVLECCREPGDEPCLLFSVHHLHGEIRIVSGNPYPVIGSVAHFPASPGSDKRRRPPRRGHGYHFVTKDRFSAISTTAETCSDLDANVSGRVCSSMSPGAGYSRRTKRRDSDCRRRSTSAGGPAPASGFLCECVLVMRVRRTASADWWITPGTAGMRPRDLFTTSRDYRESVGTGILLEGTARRPGRVTGSHAVTARPPAHTHAKTQRRYTQTVALDYQAIIMRQTFSQSDYLRLRDLDEESSSGSAVESIALQSEGSGFKF